MRSQLGEEIAGWWRNEGRGGRRLKMHRSWVRRRADSQPEMETNMCLCVVLVRSYGLNAERLSLKGVGSGFVPTRAIG